MQTIRQQTEAVKTAVDANAALPDMPFWKSKVFIGGVVSAIAMILAHFHLAGALLPEQQAQVVDFILLLLGVAGGSTAAGARLSQTKAPPITLK